jgi:acyl carrier protein
MLGWAPDKLSKTNDKLRSMENTLGLDDDLDGVELIRSVEKAFDVRIPKADAEKMRTVGDLYEWIVHNVAAHSDGRKCATAMTFYRLKRVFQRLGVGSQLLPSTELQILETKNLKVPFSDLARETGLQMPSVVPRPATIAALFMLGILAIGILASSEFLSRNAVPIPAVLALVVIVGWWAYARDNGRLPGNCSTFGELCKKTAVMNYGRLIKMGAYHAPDNVWDTLIDLLTVYALPKRQITRDTVFLASQLKNRTAA